MKLFAYQEKVLEAVSVDPCHSQLISMPTGTGKTITFLHLAKSLNKRCLILVHREELLNQTYEKAKLCGYAEEEISLVNSEKKGEIRKLTIAMVQSLARNLSKYSPNDLDAIIVDEAHHATAPSYRNIFDHFQVFEQKKQLFGFTATPLRGDKSLLSNIFESHSFKLTLSEATKMGYICPVYGLRIQIDKALDQIETVQGDYDIQALDRIMNCDEVNNIVVEKCKNLRKTPGVIFCTSVDHAHTIASMLRKEGKKAISISYKTPKSTLARIYKMLNKGSVDYITNAVKLSEGFDHPPLQSVIIVRPTRSPVLYKQMIGRGLRKHPGKEDCCVLEFTGSDPSMMRWEDIDENATFQMISKQERISEKEARKQIAQKFGKKIVILDVRLSPFNFYECFLIRLENYKKRFYYMPGKDRFLIFYLVDAEKQVKGYDKYFNVMVWHCVWNKEYEDFSLWTDGVLFYQYFGYDIPTIERDIIWKYIHVNPFGKWYPSEEDMITPRQKKILGHDSKHSARKAEFLIEDKCYRKLIEDYWINGKYSNIKEQLKKMKNQI